MTPSAARSTKVAANMWLTLTLLPSLIRKRQAGSRFTGGTNSTGISCEVAVGKIVGVPGGGGGKIGRCIRSARSSDIGPEKVSLMPAIAIDR